MTKHEKFTCYDCAFAVMARVHVRDGEQVRCLKAEELFGGERWVNVRRSEKTGKLLKPKCKQFRPFIGDTTRYPDKNAPRRYRKTCDICSGKGTITVSFMDGTELMRCYKCNGKGKIQREDKK